jgi:predicted Rossmann fold nucleotide-binding protein DprA/Smf involved in DNA uptake
MTLIREGATPIGSGGEVLEALGLNYTIRRTKYEIRNMELSNDEKIIVSVLENESLHIDDIALKTKLSTTVLGGILTMMEMKGIVKNVSGVWGLC